MTINDYINLNLELRNCNTELQSQIDANKATIEENKQHIMALMEEQGLTLLSNDLASLSIGEQTVANVKDWNVFTDYIKSNDAFYLLQKRVSNRAYAELLEAGTEVPGVEPYVQKKLNMRAKT